MHVDIIDDLNMIIYLNNMKIKTIDFSKKEDLQDCFRDLFVNLKDSYNINVNGFYNINVYKDKFYGIVLEIEKEDIDYIDYLSGQVDMNIIVDNNNTFLYEINDYFNIDKKNIDKFKLYQYKNKIYLQVIDNISSIDFGKIMEFSKIIYGDICKQILKHGKKIEVNNFSLNFK